MKTSTQNKLGGSILTLLVIFIVIVAPSADAFNLRLGPISDGTPFQGKTINFRAFVEIDSDEQVPVDHLELNFSDGKLCKFNVDGSPISGCSGLTIVQLTDTTDFSFGYNQFDFKGSSYNFGYGYGFSNSTGGILRYNVTLNTSFFATGNLAFKLVAIVDGSTFSSDKTQIIIRAPKDNQAPIIIDTDPDADIVPKTGPKTQLNVTTDENSLCKYDTRNVDFHAMRWYFGGVWTFHTIKVPIDYGRSYKFYVSCIDRQGNRIKQPNNAVIDFTVPKLSDTTAPKIIWLSPSGKVEPSNNNKVALAAYTNENTVCRYDKDNVAFSQMDGTFWGEQTAHYAWVNVQKNKDYKFYVSCKDKAGNVNQGTKKIEFKVIGAKSDPFCTAWTSCSHNQQSTTCSYNGQSFKFTRYCYS